MNDTPGGVVVGMWWNPSSGNMVSYVLYFFRSSKSYLSVGESLTLFVQHSLIQLTISMINQKSQFEQVDTPFKLLLNHQEA